MSVATAVDRRTSRAEPSPPFWEEVPAFRGTPFLECDCEPEKVALNGTGAAANAHVALEELRGLLREIVPGVFNPLLLISVLLNTQLSADSSVSASDLLLKKFGSLSNLLSRSYPDLRMGSDLDDASLLLLRAVRELVVLVLREPIEDRPLISSNQALLNYLKFTMAHETVESVKLLFLTGRNTLIRDELHTTGTVDFVSIHPREVLKRTLEVGATGLIIVHNHPSGDATPSMDDVDMTRNLKRALRTIEVSLHDHVVIGASKCYSMQENGLLS